ncbi:MAG: hypothetical protein ACI8WB_000578 [Phenylobacterium sp.]|jgi:hypothetical protein
MIDKSMGYKIAAAMAFMVFGTLLGYWLNSPPSSTPSSTPSSSSFSSPGLVQSSPKQANEASSTAQRRQNSASAQVVNTDVTDGLGLDTGEEVTITNLIAIPHQFEQLAAAHEVALTATQQQVGSLINILLNDESNPDRYALLEVFYLRYLSLNPVAAMTHFQQSLLTSREGSSPTMARRVLLGMYHHWAEIDMKGTLDYLISQQPAASRESIFGLLLADEHFADDALLLAQANDYSNVTRGMAIRANLRHDSREQAFDHILAMRC